MNINIQFPAPFNIAEWCKGSTPGSYPGDICSTQVSASKITQGGTTKKFNYKQIIKVLSSFAVITVVLLASFVLPVHAASWTTVVPANHIKETSLEGNVRKVTYDFGIPPLCFYQCTGASGSFYTSTSIPLDHDVYPPINFGIYPLGKYAEAGYNLSSSGSGQIAIDVSDFKSEAILKLGTKFHITLDLFYFSVPNSYTSEPYTLSANWSFMCYNSSGEFLGFFDASSDFKNFVLQDTDTEYTYVIEFEPYCYMSVPSDDVKYVIPLISVDLLRGTYTGNIDLRNLTFSFDNFTLSVSTDMLLKESLTLQAIEDELADLNDKADTIINGTQEQQQDGQNAVDKSDELDREFDEIMDQLEDYEKIDTSSVSSVIQDFVYTDGWLYIKDLLSPVLNWNPYIVTILVVLALVNLSVILFGR